MPDYKTEVHCKPDGTGCEPFTVVTIGKKTGQRELVCIDLNSVPPKARSMIMNAVSKAARYLR